MESQWSRKCKELLKNAWNIHTFHENSRNKHKIEQALLLTDLRTLCPQYSHKIVMGDLNADLLSKSSEAEFFRDLINELSLKVVNQGHTNHVGNFHTWIDVVCVDDNDEILAQGQESANFNNTHDLLHVTIKPHITAPPSDSFTFRKYKDITPHNLIP